MRPIARRFGIALIYVLLVALGASATYLALGGVPFAAQEPQATADVQPLSDQEVAALARPTRRATTGPVSPSVTATPDPTVPAGTSIGPGSGGGSGGGQGNPTTPAGNPTTPAQPPTTTNPPPPPPPPPPTEVQVPNVVGYNEDYAKQTISAAGLFPSVTYQGSADKCYVLEQSPGGGTTVAPGSTVHLVVAWLLGPVCKLS